jgi:hypothetical protein
MGDAMRMVNTAEWDLSGMLDRSRAARLMAPPSGEDLINIAATQARKAALQGQAYWRWQDGREMAGCGRAIASFPLDAESFDNLFNGRSGYRAQYYLSCIEGIAFNAALVGALLTSLSIACESTFPDQLPASRWSFEGPESKAWVLGDSAPFIAAREGEFSPRRWVDRSLAPSPWLRAPRPDKPGIEVKGSWVSNLDGKYRTDPDKADRHYTMHERGHA